jgi:hypothetical protein
MVVEEMHHARDLETPGSAGDNFYEWGLREPLLPVDHENRETSIGYNMSLERVRVSFEEVCVAESRSYNAKCCMNVTMSSIHASGDQREGTGSHVVQEEEAL